MLHKLANSAESYLYSYMVYMAHIAKRYTRIMSMMQHLPTNTKYLDECNTLARYTVYRTTSTRNTVHQDHAASQYSLHL